MLFRSRRRTEKAKHHTTPLLFEQLESRRLLAAGPHLSGHGNGGQHDRPGDHGPPHHGGGPGHERGGHGGRHQSAPIQGSPQQASANPPPTVQLAPPATQNPSPPTSPTNASVAASVPLTATPAAPVNSPTSSAAASTPVQPNRTAAGAEGESTPGVRTTTASRPSTAIASLSASTSSEPRARAAAFESARWFADNGALLRRAIAFRERALSTDESARAIDQQPTSALDEPAAIGERDTDELVIDRDDNEAAIDVFDEALDQLLGEWTDELTELACDATGELCQLDAASDAASDADDDNDAQTARRAARTARSPLQSLEHLNSGDAGEHIDNSASGVARGVLRQIVFSVAADGAGIDWLAVDIDLEAGWDIAAAAALQSNESVVAIDANSPATRDPRDRSAGLAAGK